MTPLAVNELIARLQEKRGKPPYLAMYSSWYEGIVTEPHFMSVPIDDHIVHRGDGIFEAFKYTEGAIYDLEGHLKRLERSAKRIFMELPDSLQGLEEKVKAVVKAALDNGGQELGLRLYVSRGPGGFDANPYASIGTQLYIIATHYSPQPEEKYEKGVKVGISKVPIKEGFFSQVKSCNYLHNVLMKKEAIDRGLAVVVNVGKDGFVGEGPTENILILTNENHLIAPSLEYTLSGTTLKCVLDLAKSQEGIEKIEYRDVKVSEIEGAKEVMLVGTTIEVMPVTEFNETPIGNGSVGSVAQALRAALREDMKANKARRTEV